MKFLFEEMRWGYGLLSVFIAFICTVFAGIFYVKIFHYAMPDLLTLLIWCGLSYAIYKKIANKKPTNPTP